MIFFYKCPSALTLCMNVAGVTTSSCEDSNKVQCPLWAKNGECEKNPAWMKVNCRKSCKVCSKYLKDFAVSLSEIRCGRREN